MKLEQIVALAVRLFAIAMAIYTLRNGISEVPYYFYEQGLQELSYLYAGLMILLLLISIVLWNFPLTVARGFVTFREQGEADISSASADQLLVVGLSILGFYLLFHVVSDIVYWAFMWLISQRNVGISMELSFDNKARIVSTVIELVFVLFLLFGTKGITELLRKFRYGNDA